MRQDIAATIRKVPSESGGCNVIRKSQERRAPLYPLTTANMYTEQEQTRTLVLLPCTDSIRLGFYCSGVVGQSIDHICSDGVRLAEPPELLRCIRLQRTPSHSVEGPLLLVAGLEEEYGGYLRLAQGYWQLIYWMAVTPVMYTAVVAHEAAAHEAVVAREVVAQSRATRSTMCMTVVAHVALAQPKAIRRLQWVLTVQLTAQVGMPNARR